MSGVWLVTAGSYSSYRVIGAVSDELAERLRSEYPDGEWGDDDYGLEHVEFIPDLTVEELWTTVQCSISVLWNGRIIGERQGEPVPATLLHGIPGVSAHRPTSRPPSLQVKTGAMEFGYTLGANLRVWGTDIERVRKVYSEMRAILIADAPMVTIREWLDRPTVPAWTFGREENAALAPALADALRAAGKGDQVDKCVQPGS